MTPGWLCGISGAESSQHIDTVSDGEDHESLRPTWPTLLTWREEDVINSVKPLADGSDTIKFWSRPAAAPPALLGPLS